jgi:hypothetical protein
MSDPAEVRPSRGPSRRDPTPGKVREQPSTSPDSGLGWCAVTLG